MRRNRLAILGGCAAAALVLMTACGTGSSGSSADAAVDDDTLVIGVDSDITSPDLSRYQNLADIFPTTNMFDTLTFRGNDGSTLPMIATKWNTSKDGLEWTVDIRTDVVFQNGEPLTAEDVAYSIMRMADPKFAEPISEYWTDVQKAEVVDKNTVAFHLSKPNGLFMQQGTRAPIVPKAYAEKVGPEEFSAHPIGSGPYEFVDWQPGEQLEMEANEDYWQGAPKIKHLIFKPIVDESARTAALRSGDIDIATVLGLEDVDSVDSDPRLDVRTTDSLERQELTFDTNVAPFDDVRVRKAVNYAINKKELVDTLLEGYAKEIAGIVVPLETGFNDDLKPYPYDPDKARKLLAEAGYPDGFDIGFGIQTGYPKSVEVTEAIAGYLEDVGIHAHIRQYDAAAYADASRDGKLEPLAFHGWGGGGQFQSTHYLNVVARCDGASVVWGGYYCNPKMDKELDAAFQLWGTDEDAAIEHSKKAQQIFHDDAGAGFLYVNTRVYGVKSGLDWEPRTDGVLWMMDASWK